MIIIPFIHRVKQIAQMQISVFQLLTVGGTMPWKEDDHLDIEQDILEPNGIYLKGKPIRLNHTYLCPVDTDKTNLTDFYQWNEISSDDHDTFCWRTFYIAGESSDYRGWLPIPSKEGFGPHRYTELFDKIHEHSKQVI
jgi:hypothetical protein